MKTGFRGTFVISWSQTELDGQKAAPMRSLQVGAAWSWHGDTIRVDGPGDRLQLNEAVGVTDMRNRAARMVHRLVGAAMQDVRADDTHSAAEDPLLDGSFVITDGSGSYTVSVIPVPVSDPLVVLLG